MNNLKLVHHRENKSPANVKKLQHDHSLHPMICAAKIYSSLTIRGGLHLEGLGVGLASKERASMRKSSSQMTAAEPVQICM